MENVNKLLSENNEEITLSLLLYRLDKLEEEQRRENKEIMHLLQTIQENQHETSKKLVQHTTELTRVNARLDKLEESKVDDNEFETTCNNVNKRLDNFNKIIIGIAISVGAFVLSQLIEIL